MQKIYYNNIQDKLLHKFAKKSSAKRIGCFPLLFLANLCNNLSYILYKKFPKLFYPNGDSKISYIFCVSFSAFLSHIFVLYMNRKYPVKYIGQNVT